MDRRTFLGTTAAYLATNLLPAPVVAQSAKFRRWEITNPLMPARVLSSYKIGIQKMLALPPDDPRNWYRNAFIHIFDCPHGNWWFLVWHRAYLGWFERTLRDLSGDTEFALPYWDWTKTQSVPPAMFVDVLDPNNNAFLASFDSFKTQFGAPVAAVFSGFSQPQKDELAKRPYPLSTPDEFWNLTEQMFYNQPNARGLKAAKPDLDPPTQAAVGVAVINRALQTTTFGGKPNQSAGFHSGQSAQHSQGTFKGILESQPHDNVHGAMGGPSHAAFMRSHLSPVDPIFFLHHANLDRLWDVWTRRQMAFRHPTLPKGADLNLWSNEPFLFFRDERGLPVTQTKAGDYADTRTFDYDYSPGSGEDQVPVAIVANNLAEAFSATIAAAPIGGAEPAGGVVQLPTTALRLPPVAPPPSLVADIALDLDHADEGRRFRVLVSTGDDAQVEAGTITIFGHPSHGQNVFEVPLPDSLRTSAAGASGDSLPLDVRVVPLPPTAASPASTARPTEAARAELNVPKVVSITIRAN